MKTMKKFVVVIEDFGNEIVEHTVIAFTEFQAGDLVQSIFPFADILDVFEA